MDNLEILSGLHYKSDVEIIVQYQNGKQTTIATHNEALPGMSEFFAQALLGYDTRSVVPTAVMLKQQTTDVHGESIEVPILLSPVILTGKNYSKVTAGTYVGYYQSSFNVLITSNYLNAQADATNTKNFLYMQNANGVEFAKIRLVNADGEEVALNSFLAAGKNLIINWKLILCNYKGE